MSFPVKHVQIYAHNIAYQFENCDNPNYEIGVPDYEGIVEQIEANGRKGKLVSCGSGGSGEDYIEFEYVGKWWIDDAIPFENWGNEWKYPE